MTYSNLNINDINDLLFPQNDIIINSRKSTKTDEFNFTQVWEEIDAAAIALNEQIPSKLEENSLAAFIGDITPAAAAVVAGESPLMNTPFLDSCIGTPFTPATVFTPSLAQFQNSPYYSPYIDNSLNMNRFSNFDCQQDDIQVSKYLKTDLSPWQSSATITADLFANTISSTDVSPELLNSLDNFNGDPTQLLLGSMENNNNTKNNNNVTTDDSDDPLFPPLPTDQQTYENTMIQTDTNHELFNPEDFDASNFLNDSFDDAFFLMQQQQEQQQPQPPQPQQPQQPQQTQQQKQVQKNPINKRKINQESDKKNKRFKPSENDEQRKFECEFCHATFNRRYNLGTHIKVHSPTRVKDFSCHLCNKAFDRKHDLTRHVATVHNGERAYSCTNCTSTFSRKDALVRHQVQKHHIKA